MAGYKISGKSMLLKVIDTQLILIIKSWHLSIEK